MKNKQGREKGAVEVATVLMWAFGLFATVSLAFTGASVSTNSDQTKQLTEHEGRISATETEVKRVDRLENKIDWLIEREGGNPSIVERRMDVATTSANQAKR